MLSIGLIIILIAIPFNSYRITPSLYNRITSIVLIYSALLAYNALYIESLASGVGIYSGLFQITTVSLSIESFLYFVGGLILLGWVDKEPKKISEYSLMIFFTTIGASFLVSSNDLVSMYISIELQSFGVYLIATLNRDSESATAAGLKYFLLGGLSSALLLLGTAVIYSTTGLTQFESIYSIAAVSNNTVNIEPLLLGLVLIIIGFLFKVGAAPFHNWAPDVYDGTPTIVTTWLTTIPKISIFVFLLELQIGLEGSFESLSLIQNSINIWKNLLLVSSLLSLIIGTVVGISQYRIKRLLAFSTISHVGFLLLALAINTEESIESFVFYILQYSLTNITIFLILLAFGNIINISPKKDILFINELKGQFQINPLLSFSFALCLFSIAGIPPLIGFFAKQMVLYSSTHAGYYFISILAILISVISASYYLKIIRVIYFDTTETLSNSIKEFTNESIFAITNIHSLLIAIITMVITLFVLQPSILLNSSNLLALSLFYY